MAEMRPGASKEAIETELKERAAQLFGAERAAGLQGPLEDMAGFLHILGENLPQREEEPGFFL